LKAIIIAALEICLLRKAPQDLPASVHLMVLSFILSLMVQILSYSHQQFDISQIIIQTLFGLGLMMGTLYVALRIKGWLPRFFQAATALMLSNFLLELLLLPLFNWNQLIPSSEAKFLVLLVVIWSIVVFGHIIHHTFEISLGIGIAAALLYIVFSWSLIDHFFAVSA
jgi:hypothetical protein